MRSLLSRIFALICIVSIAGCTGVRRSADFHNPDFLATCVPNCDGSPPLTMQQRSELQRTLRLVKPSYRSRVRYAFVANSINPHVFVIFVCKDASRADCPVINMLPNVVYENGEALAYPMNAGERRPKDFWQL